MDKDEERRHLEMLRAALPDFPDGAVDGAGENPDFVIDVLPSCVSADNPSRYPEAITAQGYLEERLREIKLK